MHVVAQEPFWANPLDQGQRVIIYYFLVIAGLAMLAQFVKTWSVIHMLVPDASVACL